VVGTADQRTGFDVAEPKGKAFCFESGEFVGVIEAGYGEMLLRGLQILPDRHDVASNCAKIAHDFSNFFWFFPHPDNQS